MASNAAATLSILLALFLFIHTSSQKLIHATVKLSISDIADSYDYIVIGGGTSGLTVADRLTEDSNSKICLSLKVGLFVNFCDFRNRPCG
jgi:hypothetical protein